MSRSNISFLFFFYWKRSTEFTSKLRPPDGLLGSITTNSPMEFPNNPPKGIRNNINNQFPPKIRTSQLNRNLPLILSVPFQSRARFLSTQRREKKERKYIFLISFSLDTCFARKRQRGNPSPFHAHEVRRRRVVEGFIDLVGVAVPWLPVRAFSRYSRAPCLTKGSSSSPYLHGRRTRLSRSPPPSPRYSGSFISRRILNLPPCSLHSRCRHLLLSWIPPLVLASERRRSRTRSRRGRTSWSTPGATPSTRPSQAPRRVTTRFRTGRATASHR